MSALLLLAPLAEKTYDPADVKPGWLAFVVFLILAVATVLLWLSFRKQLRKIDVPDDPRPVAGDTDPERHTPRP